MKPENRDISLNRLHPVILDTSALYVDIFSCQRKQIHSMVRKDFPRYKKDISNRSINLYSTHSKMNLDEKLPYLEKVSKDPSKPSTKHRLPPKSTKSHGLLNSINISRSAFPPISELELDLKTQPKSTEHSLKPKNGNPIQLYHKHMIQMKGDKKNMPFYLSTPKANRLDFDEESILLHSVNLSCMPEFKNEETRFRDRKCTRKNIFKLLTSN